MTDMTAAFEAILTDYVTRWNNYDADGMVPFWDTEDPGLIYVAEEIDALRGWPALEKYFRGADPETTDHLIAFRDVTARDAGLLDDELECLFRDREAVCQTHRR